MRTIPHLLHEHPFFAGLSDESIDMVAGCATNVRFQAGQYLFREGEQADTFYVLRHGRVAVEARTPTRSIVIDTTDEGEVLGWSWLVPPYRWTFDARAVGDVRAVSFDGACLRGKCADDAELGYAFLQRVVPVMSADLHSARVRLLDLYGRP
jgi:CRP/FNR family cyclic AMP-dependent transcriptional regulator